MLRPRDAELRAKAARMARVVVPQIPIAAPPPLDPMHSTSPC
jgi:hypothetical protein